MIKTPGLHHITAIAADPQRNVDFYEGFLGQRFVKKTVNFDDPNAYHLYYGDYLGTPGTAMTFFSWQGMPPAIPGTGAADAFYYRIPCHSMPYWLQRAEEFEVPGEETKVFGERALRLRDPDNHLLYLIESTARDTPELTMWEDSPVPLEKQLLGFYGVRLAVQRRSMIEPVLLEGLGYTAFDTDEATTRYVVEGDLGVIIDVQELPDELPARQGVGAIHHIAVRARDDAEREALREQLVELGLQPTGLVDRTFFHSTYCFTPAGVLFEIATDAPGFTVNEEAAILGERLVLPEEYEHMRAQIESHLPPILLPRHV